MLCAKNSILLRDASMAMALNLPGAIVGGYLYKLAVSSVKALSVIDIGRVGNLQQGVCLMTIHSASSPTSHIIARTKHRHRMNVVLQP